MQELVDELFYIIFQKVRDRNWIPSTAKVERNPLSVNSMTVENLLIKFLNELLNAFVLDLEV